MAARRLLSVLPIGLWSLALGLPAAAQTPPPGATVPVGGGLQANPQGGATPRLAPPSPQLPPAARIETPAIAPLSGPTLSTAPVAVAPAPHGALPDRVAPNPLPRRTLPGGLPAPSDDPMRIDPATDPLLLLTRSETAAPAFRAAIAAAVVRAPALDEAIAQRSEAQGVRNEAVARRAPTVDLSLSSFRVLSRAFSNDPQNILERSRPAYRTDGLAHLQHSIIDFGASGQRIAAGDDRLRAAMLTVEDTGTQLALRAVGAWYGVFGYRALVRLGEAFVASQRDLRGSIEDRIRQGAAASSDLAQVDSYIAASDAQLADFRRSLANAEAQYISVVGDAAPATLGRAPAPNLGGIAAGTIVADAARLPTVRAARFGADAAARDVKALRGDRLPQIAGTLDYGRYGVFENARDYDFRGTISVSLRLGGGATQRIEQAKARRDGADARFRRTRLEAERDARIALSDVEALEEAREAIAANYLASRRSRDVLNARFRVARGTLFDLLGAESNYFGVAARYLQTVIELDTARYALLARTGRLLPALAIDPTSLDPRARRLAPRYLPGDTP